MRPIPGTITDPRVDRVLYTSPLRPIIDRDPGDEQPEPTYGGPKLTATEWVILAQIVEELLDADDRIVLIFDITDEERDVLKKLRSSRLDG